MKRLFLCSLFIFLLCLCSCNANSSSNLSEGSSESISNLPSSNEDKTDSNEIIDTSTNDDVEDNKMKLLPLILTKVEVHKGEKPTGPSFDDRYYVWIYYENQNPFTVYGYINMESNGIKSFFQTWPIKNSAEDKLIVGFNSGENYVYGPVDNVDMIFSVDKVSAYYKELDKKLFEDSDPSNIISYSSEEVFN